MIRKLCLLSIVLLALSAPTTANAYWPNWGYWGWGNSGYGLGFNYNQSPLGNPPYYSIYPPVYYSPQITARHYGASPFAWPAGFQPITYTAQGEVSIPEPDIIENPFVTPRTKQTSARADEVKAVDLVNPFVTTASSPESD
jgi:hypothetical protein